ncbi:MAG: hypothetical protein ACREJO_05065 [Phycisphaerales bacterium]
MKLVPLGLVACAVAASVAFGPSAVAMGGRPGAMAGFASAPPRSRLVVIDGRAYRVACSLRVMIPGAPLDPEQPQPEIQMQCTVALTTADGRPVGRLPSRLALMLNEGRVRRSVILDVIPSDVQAPLDTEAYGGAVAAFDETDGAVAAAITVRDGRRTVTHALGNVPVEIIPLP